MKFNLYICDIENGLESTASGCSPDRNGFSGYFFIPLSTLELSEIL